MDYKNILGLAATAISVISYVPYLYGIWVGKTKPHAFTWFVWGSINIISFAAVLTGGGGIGAWVLAVNVVACITIAVIAFIQKNIIYDLIDWVALSGALLGVFLWWLTDNPLYAVIFVALSDGLGFIPTFRKAYHKPFEENVSSFSLGVLYYILALFALTSFTMTTSFYQFAVIIMDASFVIMTISRRRQLSVR